MKKDKRYFYRIKDLNTGLYFSHKTYCQPDWKEEVDRLKKEANYTYSKSSGNYGFSRLWFYGLFFNKEGRLYSSKTGAERMISEFTSSNKHDRSTTAGRLLNSKFNFIAVKCELKIKDVKDE